MQEVVEQPFAGLISWHFWQTIQTNLIAICKLNTWRKNAFQIHIVVFALVLLDEWIGFGLKILLKVYCFQWKRKTFYLMKNRDRCERKNQVANDMNLWRYSSICMCVDFMYTWIYEASNFASLLNSLYFYLPFAAATLYVKAEMKKKKHFKHDDSSKNWIIAMLFRCAKFRF